jgi:hypothetical protein
MSNIDNKMIYTCFITVTIAISVISYFIIRELNNKINDSKIYYDRLCTLEKNMSFLEDTHESDMLTYNDQLFNLKNNLSFSKDKHEADMLTIDDSIKDVINRSNKRIDNFTRNIDSCINVLDTHVSDFVNQQHVLILRINAHDEIFRQIL